MINEKVIIFVAGIILGASIPTALYLYSTKQFGELKSEYESAVSELGRARQTLDAVRARATVTEQGLAEAVGTIGTITDRNRRITILVETIRAAIVQLRAINEAIGTGYSEGGEGTKPLAPGIDNSR